MSGNAGEIVYLGILAICFAIVVFAYAMLLMCIADFETGDISLNQCVAKLNSQYKAYFIIWIVFEILVILPPSSSFVLFLEVGCIILMDVVLMFKKKYVIHARWAVKNMKMIKIQGIARLVILFLCVATCCLRIIL